MANIIEELQIEAVDQSTSVTALLRKVKYVAVKLNLDDTVDWADHELRGYENTVPAYRLISGLPKAYSPYHGAQVLSGPSKLLEAMSKRAVGLPISAIEDLLNGRKNTDFKMPFPADITEKLLKGNYGWTEAYLDIPRSNLVAIVDHVRTATLDWALALEKRGIIGEGRSFSEQEKTAASAMGVSIQNFYGQMSTGDASGANSRINLASSDSSTNTVNAEQLFNQVETAIRDLQVEKRDEESLLEALDDMRKGHARGSFSTAYAKFVTLAADHMTVFGPFLPAIAALLT